MDNIPLDYSNEILLISCAKFGDEFYGSIFDKGLIVQVDLLSGKCSLTGGINQCESIRWRNTIGYGRYGDCIYFVEDRCTRIAIYSLSNGNLNFINIEGRFYTDFQNNKSLITTYGNRMFLFPVFDDKVIVIDMSSNKVENVCSICPNASYEYQEEERDTLIGNVLYPLPLFSHAIQVDECVFLFSPILSYVIRFSLITLQIENIPIHGDYEGLVDVSYRKGYFYMLDKWGDVYRWRMNQVETELFVSMNYDKCDYYERLLPTDDNIWLLPCYGKCIHIVDIRTGNKQVYEDYPMGFRYIETNTERSKFGYGCDDENDYYLATFSANYMLKINKITGNGKWIFLHGVGEKEIKKYYQGMGVFGTCFENDEITLNDFLSNKSKFKKKSTPKYMNIGTEIWNMIVV